MVAHTTDAADYPDINAAVIGAQRQFQASHIEHRGGDVAAVYSSTAIGYVKRNLFRKGGGLHWELGGTTVSDLPRDAQFIWEWEQGKREPESMRRAAEADKKPTMTVVLRQEKNPYARGGYAWASYDLSGVPLYMGGEDLESLKERIRVDLPHKRVRFVVKDETTRAKETTGAKKMGAVRETREQGRHYESAQWLEFECEPAQPTPELEEMAREFKKLVLEFLESYARTWSIDLSSLDEDSFVWNAYASLVGHGVGLWEGDGDTGLRGEDEKKIDKALKHGAKGSGAAHKIWSLAHQISDECSMLSEGAGGREASEASIPTKAQLKIIEAFRARRLMGNPMRDAISTDGDTIYSYRMPIARRTRNGGVWIIDPASAPSATTRNHIYGLLRTFTPAEIYGTTKAAEHRDDSPKTERAPAPEAAPRLQPGYAFYTPSRRKGDWKKIPNDDWEHVVVGEDEIEKANLVGMRLIDGSMHDIFEIVFAAGRGGRGYYAQLQTHTRGRSAAHEQHVLLQANDFASPKEAVTHAQNAWGATHVDFHGTRNRPTVYGTKNGARWKKTLYKEKGKFHWPDKFFKGPKRLHGAIELTPVESPALPTPVPMRTPPMAPPHGRPIPPRVSGPSRSGYLAEARENPATDLQDAIPWVRVTRDPERYKEALARAKAIGPVDDAKKVYELVGPALLKEDQETFMVVLIDVRQNCRGVAEIHRGERSRVATSTLDVMRVVVASGAEGFIVVHNHPSGNAMPSDADRSLTKAIERAARPFKGETAFLDHVVCGNGEFYSFADNKLHRMKN